MGASSKDCLPRAAQEWAPEEGEIAASRPEGEHWAWEAEVVWIGASKLRPLGAVILRQARLPHQQSLILRFRFTQALCRLWLGTTKEIVKLEEINRAPASLQGGTHPARRIPPWLLGILVAGGLTFVAGFYLPQQEASAVLAGDLKRLANEYEQSVAAYEKINAELAAAQKVRDEQAGQLGEISELKSRAQKSVSELKGDLEGALEKFVKAKALSVQKEDDNVTISLESLYLVYPHKTFVHDRGKQLLCEIAKALPKNLGRPTEIIAHVNGDEPWSGILKKEFPSTFQLSATIASDVTQQLALCGATADGLRAVGAGHFEGDPKLARKSVARIEIVVYPEAPQ